MDQDTIDNWDGSGPLPSLYVKTASGSINVWTVWVQGCYVCMRWGQKDGVMQEGRYACAPKNVGKANATTPEQQAMLEALSRWRKQMKGGYRPDVDSTASFNLRPMLAKKLVDIPEKRLSWPATLQPKYDGLRCLAYRKDGQVRLQSRGGDPYVVDHVVEELERALPDGMILDGELYVHGTSLQTINSWVRRPQPDSLLVQYWLYDVTWLDDQYKETPWSERERCLREWYTSRFNGPSSIYLSPSWLVNDRSEMEKLHVQLVEAGFEGVIVRLFDGKYRFGFRSGDLLKYKSFDDAEFVIVGWTAGKGKFENAPIFKLDNGRGGLFEAVPKGTNAERWQMLQDAQNLVGKMLTVRFFGYTDEGIPRFPVGIAIRDPSDQ